MTWSKYLTAIRQSLQRSSRNGAKIQSVILHHGATTNDELMIQMMVSGSREVSAQAVVKDGRRTGVVDEDYRAWTSASAYWDGRSNTIECANESTNGWTISDASYNSMAILLADWSIRYNFALIRNGRNSTVFGHRELYQFFGDSYATACPGGMDVDRVVREANAIKAQWAQPSVDYALLRRQKEETMYVRGTSNVNTIYNVYTDANGNPRLRVCGKNEAAYAVAGGLVVRGDDPTLTNLGNELGYKFGAKPPLPVVEVAD